MINMEDIEINNGFTYLELKENPEALINLRVTKMCEKSEDVRLKLQEIN